MTSFLRFSPLRAIVVFVALYTCQRSVSGDLEPLFDRCCQIGSSWTKNHTSCSGPSTVIPGVTMNDRSTCYTVIYVCCIRSHRATNCERGMNTARLGRTCDVLPIHGGETHKDCCDGCTLGLKVSSMRMSCALTDFAFGSPWDRAYMDCCINSSPDQGTSPLSGGTNRCKTQNPCSQVCDDSGEQIRCSCYVGYHLSSDQRTCEDDDECQSETHSCNRVTHVCVNSNGGFQCVDKGTLPAPSQNVQGGRCPVGYQWNQATSTCDDIDECTLGLCSTENEVCVNSIGSFTCTTKMTPCQPGFRHQATTNRCIDVDECAEGIHTCDREEEQCLNSHGAYLCQLNSRRSKDCSAGLKWNEGQARCEDVDECAENLHNCNPANEVCQNTLGNFVCVPRALQCPYGYRKNSNENKCEDINECIEQTDDCDRSRQYCVNTLGSYQCQTKSLPPGPRCGTGYYLDGATGICKDIDECVEATPCSSDQTCENTIGSYQCRCQQGYTADHVNRTCKDVNECQLGLHSCGQSQRCDNTIGSYTCVRTTSCGTGYTLNAGLGECEDDDECALQSHNCGPGFVCRNTLGSFRCDRVRCPPGQKLLPDGSCQVIACTKGMEPDASGNCVDINECSRNNACRINQRCINSVGSYRCQNLLNCGAGFELNESGNRCVDIDECARRIDECGSQQSCRNRPGGYVCECPPGYSLNAQRACEDVDECTRFQSQVCSVNSECQNTQGSYVCNCKEGFKKGEDGKNCIDNDECAESPGICHQNCINAWGSYHCSCRPGFVLQPDERSCKDIDECSLWEGKGSLCIGFCVNEPGSYSCSCPDGYRLAPDKRTCQDIDECQEQGVCKGQNEVCLNTRGSFRCNTITCPPKYERDRDHRNRCKRSELGCPADNSDCLKDPVSFSYNFITFVSNMRIPPSGQLDLFTMRGPRFAFTTVQFSLELKDARSPEGVPTATRENFHLRRTAFNEAMMSLGKTIPGPQEIELELVMKMYHNGLFGGTAIAKIFIFVTRYEF